MESLLQLVLSPPENVRVFYRDDVEEEYCLISKKYRIFPKEIKDKKGNMVTRSLKCSGFGVDLHDQNTYHQYETVVKNYLATTSDPIEVNYFGPKEKTGRVAKPEYADMIKQTEEARQQHQNKVDQLEKKFHEDLAALGAYGLVEFVSVETWPQNCQLKDEWYEAHQEMDYSKCQINLDFHSETELYKTLIARKVLHGDNDDSYSDNSDSDDSDD